MSRNVAPVEHSTSSRAGILDSRPLDVRAGWIRMRYLQIARFSRLYLAGSCDSQVLRIFALNVTAVYADSDYHIMVPSKPGKYFCLQILDSNRFGGFIV
jgi:hypothetical protein